MNFKIWNYFRWVIMNHGLWKIILNKYQFLILIKVWAFYIRIIYMVNKYVFYCENRWEPYFTDNPHTFGTFNIFWNHLQIFFVYNKSLSKTILKKNMLLTRFLGNWIKVLIMLLLQWCENWKFLNFSNS